MTEANSIPVTQLGLLAISDQGFVFNPATGDSFVCNASGLTVLKALKEETSIADLVQSMSSRYAISEADAERDVMEFVQSLRMMKLG